MPPRRVPLALVGASSKAHAPAQQSGRTINLYPEANASDAKAIVALRAVPGQFRWRDFSDVEFGGLAELADTTIRGMHTMGERAFVVVGNKLCEIYPQNDYMVLATLNTTSGFVGMSDNAGKLVIGDGSYYTFDFDAAPPGDGVLDPVLTTELEHLRGYTPIYLDGVTIYPLRNQSRYAYSAVGDPTTIDDLWFMGAEADPDPISTGFAVGGDVPLLGPDSIEVHRNYGDADNPFQRIPGARIELGVVGKRAACEADGTVFLVGRNKDGAGQVYRLGAPGQIPQKVSNQAVEEAIAKVLFSYTDIADLITMYSYQEAGHTFVCINMPMADETVNNPAQPSKTWVYDVSLPPDLAWHERGFMNPATGRFERGLPDHHIFWKGKHYTGSYDAPHVYQQSLDFFRENTLPLVKQRVSGGPLNLDDRRFKVNRVGIMVQPGKGRDGDVQGSDPQMILRYSWDSGQTWSGEMFRSLGRIGDFDREVVFGACGSGRNFVVEVTCSEPIAFTLIGGWADVTVAER